MKTRPTKINFTSRSTGLQTAVNLTRTRTRHTRAAAPLTYGEKAHANCFMANSVNFPDVDRGSVVEADWPNIDFSSSQKNMPPMVKTQWSKQFPNLQSTSVPVT
jgi:hypothetical protein